MFVENEDTIDIKIYYKKVKHTFKVYNEKNFMNLKLTEEEAKKYDCVNIKMLEMTWGLFNDLQESSMVENASGESKFNFKTFKENKFKKTIKSWDAKDKNGKPVPVNDNTISKLSPVMAETILNTYDEISMLTEEDEKK